MTPLRRWGRGSRLALGGVIASTALALAALGNARRPVRLPDPTPPEVRLPLAAAGATRQGASDRAVLAAVARAPFRPDRRPPAVQYQLPSQRRPAEPVRLPSPFLRSRLVGTVLQPSGGLAMVELPGSGSRVMAVGDSLEGFRLVKVERGAATFAGPDSMVTFRVAPPR